jgi:hypothetical protein
MYLTKTQLMAYLQSNPKVNSTAEDGNDEIKNVTKLADTENRPPSYP